MSTETRPDQTERSSDTVAGSHALTPAAARAKARLRARAFQQRPADAAARRPGTGPEPTSSRLRAFAGRTAVAFLALVGAAFLVGVTIESAGWDLPM